MKQKIKPIRPLEKQFDKPTLMKIRSLQDLILDFPDVEGGGKYYLKELLASLEAGLLLSSLHLALSFMELITRDLLIYTKANEIQKKSIDYFEILMEDSTKPSYTFSFIVSELLKCKVIDVVEAQNLKDYYRKIRIPLHHGLTRRFVRAGERSTPDEINDIFEKLFYKKSWRGHRFEEIIENDSIDIITAVFILLKPVCEKILSNN